MAGCRALFCAEHTVAMSPRVLPGRARWGRWRLRRLHRRPLWDRGRKLLLQRLPCAPPLRGPSRRCARWLRRQGGPLERRRRDGRPSRRLGLLTRLRGCFVSRRGSSRRRLRRRVFSGGHRAVRKANKRVAVLFLERGHHRLHPARHRLVGHLVPGQLPAEYSPGCNWQESNRQG